MPNLTLPHRIEKPDTVEGLVLESWAQGLLVGAFVIMAGITVANMRKGVLLHKLILIEVRSISSRLPAWKLTDTIANLGHASWNIYICEWSGIWMVSFLHGHLPQHLMGYA